MNDQLQGIRKRAFVALSRHSSDICLERLSQDSRWPRPRFYWGYPECTYICRALSRTSPIGCAISGIHAILSILLSVCGYYIPVVVLLYFTPLFPCLIGRRTLLHWVFFFWTHNKFVYVIVKRTVPNIVMLTITECYTRLRDQVIIWFRMCRKKYIFHIHMYEQSLWLEWVPRNGIRKHCFTQFIADHAAWWGRLTVQLAN